MPTDFQLAMNKVDREMEEAVKKHGTVTLPNSHTDEFYERIEREKAKIVRSA